MLQTASTLAAAGRARALSLPEQVAAPSPAREAALEGFRQRNALLDGLFYDVGVIADAEARLIGPRWAAEGAILTVPPSGAGALRLHRSVDAFVADDGAAVRTLAVAGVGSSALGSAAFARNIADAVGAPVAAVVSGYGLADVAAEALGGFFWFGAVNGWRHAFEGLDRLTEPPVVADPGVLTGMIARRSKDTRTVLALLEDATLDFDLLVGHSKGNLVLSEALYELTRCHPARAEALAERARIVTVSATVAMPRPFRRVIDVIGALDGFGALNSRWDIKPERVVPSAWHHTNTELPLHLPVTPTLASVLG